MAGEIQFNGPKTGATCYFLTRDRTGRPWNVASGYFEAYTSVDYSMYSVSTTEQGSSNFYVGNFPSAIVPGVYSVVAKQQLGGSVAESDPFVAQGDYQWNGTVTLPLSDLVTSGQFSQIAPIRLARGNAINNFEFWLVSATDHVTPLTSGVVSGQISRDGGAFATLQSGGVTEIGQGCYAVNLTSGDLLCNTAGLLFTAIGCSGGSSDPRRFSFVMQRTSGQ